jgi:hypothetical protein
MNYEKKRKRNNGRQGIGTESERARIYRQAYYDAQSELIGRFIEAGILPPITFERKPMTQAEIIELYPPIDKL